MSGAAPAEGAIRAPAAIAAGASPRSQAVRRATDRAFLAACLAFTSLAVVILAVLLVTVWRDGHVRVGWDFLGNYASRRASEAGVRAPLWGSIWVCAVCALAALPVGVGTAVYLEEFARKDRWYNRIVELNVQNLAAVPSVVFGLLGLAFIKRGPLGLGSTVLTASLVLTMLVLPTVIIVSREAIRAVPDSLRQGSLALGATKMQTVGRQVLPNAIPGILTGSILSVSRALGESAPLLMLGALTFITFNPDALDSPYTVLPLQIFSYISNAKKDFEPLAAAAIVVLLGTLLVLNAAAIFLRNRFQKRW